MTYSKKKLHLELELPWLTKHHDDRKVRVSGLSKKLDPERLKFYLAALSQNMVIDTFFNGNKTRAVAMFKEPLGMFLNIFYCSINGRKLQI